LEVLYGIPTRGYAVVAEQAMIRWRVWGNGVDHRVRVLWQRESEEINVVERRNTLEKLSESGTRNYIDSPPTCLNWDGIGPQRELKPKYQGFVKIKYESGSLALDFARM
jgi:hypothetical protein